jgi:DNA-binding response OmpR family regulator
VRALVVEDDKNLNRQLVAALTDAGFAVDTASDGEEGFFLGETEPYDVVVLDIGLPKMDGLSVLEQWRRQDKKMPVILLTVRGAEVDKVRGFRSGADDYVVKPFSIRELLARVDAVLRRSPERPQPIAAVSIPGGTADLERREVRFDDGSRVELSEREVELLRYLASHPGRALSRDEILRHVWRLDPTHLETRTIDVHVGNLRAKLRDTGAVPRVILTARGKGYMLTHAP